MENQLLIDNSLLFIINMPGLLERFVNMFRSALDDKYKKIMRPLPSQDTQEILKMARFFSKFLNQTLIFFFRKLVTISCQQNWEEIMGRLTISKSFGRRNFQSIQPSFQN